ncbi:MAG: DUF1735 domain-containing protein [Salinibacter sp.]|uniref:DUF1735 domain-containing protein n=1 Tax=Salinibacter sp. TaxID=2065818 RepID=UPI0035D40D35
MRLLRYFLVLAVLGLFVTACDLFERRNRSYQGNPKLEFQPLTRTVDEPVNGDTTVTVNINLIGPQQSSSVPVSFAADDSSSAQSGTHFTLPSSSASIPANSSTTEVDITVKNNDQDDGNSNYVLFLSLQDTNQGDNITPATNLRTHTLTIRGLNEN